VSEAALVLFSGGQDSATCLAWALDRFDHVETIGFEYGQRHRIELEVREPIVSAIRAAFPGWSEKLGDDHLIDLGVVGALGATALTSDMAIAMAEGGLPNTFIPGRNLLFLTCAAAIAYRRGIRHLVTGVCETDFSGYPDCRDDTMKAMQLALNLGMERRFVIHTPLMWIDKAETWRMAESLGGPALIALIRTQTHTCYLGDRDTEREWGFGCGSCPACVLRKLGWKKYKNVLF
jgi:7-cyano-7-deazaguanine synthase